MLNMTTLLILSMLALLLGAGMGRLMQQHAWGLAALKGLMASFIGGLLFLDLLPDAYAKTGPVSLVFVGLGLLVMILPERLMNRRSKQERSGRFFTAEMLWVGLILHQVTDGMGLALASTDTLDNGQLAMVVIAHRMPVAAVVFWLFLRKGDPRQAWLRIAAMAAATLVGASFSHTLSPLLSSNAVNLFYAFIAGSFMHLMLHDFIDHHAHLKHDRHAEFWAFVLGIILLMVTEAVPIGELMHSHSAGEQVLQTGEVLAQGFTTSFLVLVRETAPYLLLGLIISGLLHVYMPASPINWLKQGTALSQSAKGMLFGLPLPICSCGVLPLFLSLARKGVPPACAVAFLIATPELGVDSFLLSVKLLGLKFSIVRLLMAMVLPIAIALIAVRFLPERAVSSEPVANCCAHEQEQHAHAASIEAYRPWKFAFVKLVDDIFPYVFFGLFIAALAQTLWPATSFGQLVGHWDVILLGLIGIPFYVCASASVPFALVLLQHGFSVGAVVVFLFAGPATNVATILTVSKAFGPRTGLKLAATAFICAVISGFLINAIYSPEVLDILRVHEHDWSYFDLFATASILLLCLASLYRNGPLHWLSNVMGMIPGLIRHPPEANAH